MFLIMSALLVRQGVSTTQATTRFLSQTRRVLPYHAMRVAMVTRGSRALACAQQATRVMLCMAHLVRCPDAVLVHQAFTQLKGTERRASHVQQVSTLA